MQSHRKGPNKNELKLAAIKKYGVAGMRWGERALKRKAEQDKIIMANATAIQAGEDAKVTSAIADAMELEVTGNRRRTKSEKYQHISALKGVYSRMFRTGVDAKLLMELIQSSSMNDVQSFKPVPTAKGSVALHGERDRPTSSQILRHAEFLRDISEKLTATADRYNAEVESSYTYFGEGGPTLKPVGEMSDEDLIEHFR